MPCDDQLGVKQACVLTRHIVLETNFETVIRGCAFFKQPDTCDIGNTTQLCSYWCSDRDACNQAASFHFQSLSSIYFFYLIFMFIIIVYFKK